MSSHYNGSQEREWPGSEQDPDWCYFCDRPKYDCACDEDGYEAADSALTEAFEEDER
jgi:hypothetical protein